MCRLLLCSAAAVFDCLTPQLGSSATGSKAGWVLEDSKTVPDDVLLALVAYLTPQEVAVSAHVLFPPDAQAPPASVQTVLTCL